MMRWLVSVLTFDTTWRCHGIDDVILGEVTRIDVFTWLLSIRSCSSSILMHNFSFGSTLWIITTLYPTELLAHPLLSFPSTGETGTGTDVADQWEWTWHGWPWGRTWVVFMLEMYSCMFIYVGWILPMLYVWDNHWHRMVYACLCWCCRMVMCWVDATWWWIITISLCMLVVDGLRPIGCVACGWGLRPIWCYVIIVMDG